MTTKTLPKAILLAAIVTFLHVGIPLLAWGPADISSFLDHPARAAYLILAAIASISGVVILSTSAASATSKGREDTLVKRQGAILNLVKVVGIASIWLAPYCDRIGWAVIAQADSIRYLGLIFYLFGGTLAFWSTYVLGKQFSVHVTLQQDHQLITQGPFALIRHPRYLGLIFFALGFTLIFRSYIGLIGCLIYAILIQTRITDEEKLLANAFPQQWKTYTKKTKRILPFLY